MWDRARDDSRVQGTTHECKVRKIMSVSENLKEREACDRGKRVWIGASSAGVGKVCEDHL